MIINALETSRLHYYFAEMVIFEGVLEASANTACMLTKNEWLLTRISYKQPSSPVLPQ